MICHELALQSEKHGTVWQNAQGFYRVICSKIDLSGQIVGENVSEKYEWPLPRSYISFALHLLINVRRFCFVLK